MEDIFYREEWRDIDIKAVYYYQVSQYGRVRVKKHILGDWEIIKPKRTPGQYTRIQLHIDDGISRNVAVHRLVAQAFIPNPDNKPCINHKNLNKTDNRASNLEWVTHAENSRHAAEHGVLTGRSKPIKCVETQRVYPSYVAAAQEHGTQWTTALQIAVKDPNRTAFGYHWCSI